MTKADLANMLVRFVGDEPGCGDWEWDDFVSTLAEPELEPFRLRLAEIDLPNDGAAIRQIIQELRAHAEN